MKEPKATPPMERELNYLLYDLCVKWGFCIPSNSAKMISKYQSIGADQFATLVLEAEGMNPELELKWMKKISLIFKQRFGQENINSVFFEGRTRGEQESW